MGLSSKESLMGRYLKGGVMLLLLLLLMAIVTNLVGVFSAHGPSISSSSQFAFAPPPVEAAGETFLEKEAGITAYARLEWLESADKNWSKILGQFYSIEKQDVGYVVGTLRMYPISVKTLSGMEPHVYVSKNGWVVAYFLKNEPAVRLICWPGGSVCPGGEGSNTLGWAIQQVSAAGAAVAKDVSYFDFRYPSANRLFVARGNTFSVLVPSSMTVYERSFSIHVKSYSQCSDGIIKVKIDDSLLGTNAGCGITVGIVSPTYLTTDTYHQITWESPFSSFAPYGVALAIIAKE